MGANKRGIYEQKNGKNKTHLEHRIKIDNISFCD